MPEPAKNLTALKQSKKSLVAMGKNILIYINVGTDETTGAKWELLGGQRTGDLNLKADSIDASHKGTGGWKTTLPGMKEWSTEVESILMLNDETLKVVYQAFLNDERNHMLQDGHLSQITLRLAHTMMWLLVKSHLTVTVHCLN